MAREYVSQNNTQADLTGAEAHLVRYKVPFIALSRILYVTTLIYPVPLPMRLFEGRKREEKGSLQLSRSQCSIFNSFLIASNPLGC